MRLDCWQQIKAMCPQVHCYCPLCPVFVNLRNCTRAHYIRVAWDCLYTIFFNLHIAQWDSWWPLHFVI